LNTLRPAPGHKTAAKRVGRGIGSGLGKTAGAWPQGPDIPCRRYRTAPVLRAARCRCKKRLPKYGFTSRIGAVTAEIRLAELNKVEGDVVDIGRFAQSGSGERKMKRAKVFLAANSTRRLP